MKKANSTSICQEVQFEQIYQNLVKGLYHFIYYKCGDKEMAEDIVQEAFLKLWENCAKVNTESAKGYLFTIAKHVFLNKIERKKVALKFENQIIASSEKENPAFILEQMEFQKQLEAAIDQLPDIQREVFLLNRIDKLKYREIAELLNISQKAVEKRMHNALLTLRKLHKNI